MTASPTSEHRVHADRVAIDPQSVRAFFADRATRATSEHPLTSVLYQDAHPELAEQRDRFERAFALPLLELHPGSAVLDVACGIGRWAASVLPVTTDYVGVDLSEELLIAARARYVGTGARFVQLPADELGLEALDRSSGFDRMLVAGLLLYLNDDAVERLLAALVAVARPACRIYLREPLAVTERLTLRDFWSAELGSTYSAVYRTGAEVDEMLATTLLAAGFERVAGGDLYPDTLNNRAETRQRYLVLARR
jgi:SAM-dependent methyltransferase